MKMPESLSNTTELPMKHVDKGWGYERWVVNSPEYCGKLLYFNKGKRCSWHYHKAKDEVFYLQWFPRTSKLNAFALLAAAASADERNL